MEYEYDLLEKLFAELFSEIGCSLNVSESGDVKGFIDHGEYGLALEDLCEILRETKTPISKKVLKLIETLGKKMDLEEETWGEFVVND